MSWARLDDGFVEHAKVVGLSDRAFRLHITALCYCARNLTDGLVSRLALRSVGSNTNLTRPKSTASALVRAGLWDVDGDGYRIHDYLVYNPTKAAVERERAKARARMARHRSPELPPNGSPEGSPERSPSPTPTTATRKRSSRGPTTEHSAAVAPGSQGGRATANGKRPAIEIAVDRVRNVGAELPPGHLTDELHALLRDRYHELTDDDLEQLETQHANMLRPDSDIPF